MKILIVTTSNDRFGPKGHPTGVWFEEFADPYMEFLAANMEVIVASPRGGQMPIDPRTLPTDVRKIAWAPAIEAARTTRPLSAVSSTDFDGLVLPGGHGPMFDLPDDEDLHRLVRAFHSERKLIGGVCHGPAGIVNVRDASGQYLVNGITLTAYTYAEETAEKLDKKVPFILEERLRQHGANFIEREVRADHVEQDGLFITGQNPQSSLSTARVMAAILSKRLPPPVNLVPNGKYDVQTIATFPAGTFLENLAVSPTGKLAVSSMEENAVYCIPFDDLPFVRARLPMPAGLQWLDEDRILIASTSSKAPGLYVSASTSPARCVVPIPGAKLLNGLMHLDGSRYLVADSYAASIWLADIEAGTAERWLTHPTLAQGAAPSHPVAAFPGVNGIRRFGNTVFASSTQQQKLIAIPLLDGLQAGTPGVHQTLLSLDDFAFDVGGDLYGATHVYNSLVRVTPDRRVAVLADLKEGLAGSTAVAFGRTSAHETCVFVTTNGGKSLPPEGGVQPARVLRINVQKKGYFPEA